MPCRYIITLLFICFSLNISAQKRDTSYRKLWVEVDTLLIKKNLPKSALTKVNTIYKLASADGNNVQVIKALIYRLGLEERVFDNKPNNAIALLEQEIVSAKNESVKSILYCLLANTYRQFYYNNRWKYYNRSKTINFNKTDIETWNADDFGEAISKNYLKSVEKASLLQNVSLDEFEAIIIKGNARKLRPTLYDLLIHEALDYFKTGDYYLTKPAYAFELKDISALRLSKLFFYNGYTSPDSASHLLIALKLFQQIEQFHFFNEANRNAYIDVAIERLQWVYANLNHPNKFNEYYASLKYLSEYKESMSAKAAYLLAQLENEAANSYQPFGDTSKRWNKINALAIIDKALAKSKQADEMSYNLQELKNTILSKQLNIQLEKVNVPETPFRALVSYKNIDTVFIRIIKADKSINKMMNEGNFKKLVKLKYIHTFFQPLPSAKDYQTHATEIKLDGLPVGEYILLASSSNNFNDTLDRMSRQQLYVSSISYIKNGKDYFVLNRETGNPLSKVKVDIIKREWDYKTRDYSELQVASKVTDMNGYFSFNPQDSYGSYRFYFKSKNDRLSLSDEEYINNSYSYSNAEDEDYDEDEAAEYASEKAKVYFFTDRSIYRPGQTVYFKGLGITKDIKTGYSKLFVSKDSITVFLYDVNRKKIDSLKLLSNGYGSFAGKFILPQNVLTGGFNLSTEEFNYVNGSFNVEEYKRPKFYVEFEKVKGNYRLNDTVRVIGYAKAYAGNSIDGAKVKYTVQRNARFIYDWFWRGRSMPRTGKQQIADSTITTDANGKFEILFKALPDGGLDKNSDPVFDFSITADVTDINGETRSNNTNVSVGYKSVLLNTTVPKIALSDSIQTISFATTNLSGEAVPAAITIQLFPIQTPERLIRKRLWQRPDLFVMSKQSYINYFPFDDYDDELNENNWTIGKQLFSSNQNTATTSQLKLPKLAEGQYRIEFTTKDKEGNTINDIQYMQLFNKQATAYPLYNFSYYITSNVLPAQTASFYTGSMAANNFTIRQTVRPTLNKKSRQSYSFLQRKKGLELLTYTADETDRGNVTITEAFVRNNRMYTNTFLVQVPWDNKQLNVAYTSYRNKTEPGNKETWTVTVTGNKGEKVAAEVLTSMYDASLDQFKQHSWNQPSLWPSNYAASRFSEGAGFGLQYSSENYLPQKNIPYTAIVYNELAKNLRRLSNKAWIEYKADTSIDLTVVLDRSESGLNDVVVVGYGETKKKEFTGAMSKISSSELQGAVPGIQIRGSASTSGNSKPLYIIDGVPFEGDISSINPNDIASIEVLKDETATALYGSRAANGAVVYSTKAGVKKQQEQIQPRKQFNETAFFLPQLTADTSGNYTFSFTMPESLTKWKWQTMAHTKDLAFGSNTTTIITQKTLMVQPNAPRFLREGDQMEFAVKVSNLFDKELTGTAQLALIDPITGNSVDGWFQNSFPVQYFTAAAGQSTVVKFPLQIPFGYNKPVTWRIVAKAGQFGDGEENILPILTNRALVTESLPLYMKPGVTNKSFTFDKLLTNTSQSLVNESITVEYTANPVWTVVQSLPYLMEYPYECAEQTFNRLYANTLAADIINKYPRIKEVFNQWKNDTVALKSNLQKNEELKQILLQETPWVLNAESEEQKQKNIALLFDLVKMSNSADAALEKLKQLQMPSGGFAWFKGGREDRYITNYILTGIGKLKNIKAFSAATESKIMELVTKAISFLDESANEDYSWLVKNKVDLSKNNLSSTAIQYLYMRSFYTDKMNNRTAYSYYYGQAKQYWNTQNSYHAAMIGLTLYRNNERRFVNVNLLPSVLENALEDTAKGTYYWKDRNTCFWYASPIEHQSMMIEFMNEIYQKEKFQKLQSQIDAAKTWLILNKQANHWQTTVATADACYALLNGGSNWIANNSQAKITLGNEVVVASSSSSAQATAGSGYIKQRLTAEKIKPQLGNIQVNVQQAASQPSYGAVYWQYFEDLDKITAAASPLSLQKKLFIEKNSSSGKILEPVNNKDELKVGDKIVVRIELRSDRDMEYLHLKDMRASGTEPINVLSGYKWQDGLGYYESTKDASTNFFIDKLRKGTYVFEYPLYVTHTGVFSVGIANIQCMYAPEFTSHSEGIKINVRQ